jgi:hypothetical protein
VPPIVPVAGGQLTRGGADLGVTELQCRLTGDGLAQLPLGRPPQPENAVVQGTRPSAAGTLKSSS